MTSLRARAEKFWDDFFIERKGRLTVGSPKGEIVDALTQFAAEAVAAERERCERICRERGNTAIDRARNPEKFMPNKQGDPSYYASHQEAVAISAWDCADAIEAIKGPQ